MIRYIIILLAYLFFSIEVSAQFHGIEKPELLKEQYSPKLAKAVLHFNDGEYKKTLNSLKHLRPKKNSSIAPDQYYLIEGLSNFYLEQYEKARNAFNLSLDYKQSNSDAIAYLALTQFALEQHEQALTRLDEALWYGKSKLVPRERLLFFMAASYEEKEQLAEALKYYKQALSANSEFSEARIRVSDLLFLSGKKQEAISQLRQIIKKQPEHEKAKVKLASRLLSGASRLLSKKAISEAKELSAKVLEGKESAELYRHPAFPIHVRALIDSGETNSAEEQLQLALKEYPTSPTLQRLRRQMMVEREAQEYEANLDLEQEEAEALKEKEEREIRLKKKKKDKTEAEESVQVNPTDTK